MCHYIGSPKLPGIPYRIIYSAIDLMGADANQSGVALVEPDNRWSGKNAGCRRSRGALIMATDAELPAPSVFACQ